MLVTAEPHTAGLSLRTRLPFGWVLLFYKRGIPLTFNCNIAEDSLVWAGQQNPGKWIEHSRYVALACKNIAAQCENMDADRAYCFGLLHDIGTVSYTHLTLPTIA